EDGVNGLVVPDVGVDVAIAIAQAALEALALVAGGRFLAEEALAHVVVDADDVQTLLGEVAGRLRADQPGRSSNHCDTHGLFSLLKGERIISRCSPQSPGRRPAGRAGPVPTESSDVSRPHSPPGCARSRRGPDTPRRAREPPPPAGPRRMKKERRSARPRPTR